MNTYRDIVYMCLDLVKLMSDDTYYTEDHVMYLMDKYRAYLLKKLYADQKKEIPRSNYQTLVIDNLHLAKRNTDNGTIDQIESLDATTKDTVEFMLRGEKSSTTTDSVTTQDKAIPKLINVINPFVYCPTYKLGELTYVAPQRLQYVGHNKWLKQIIYCTIKDNTLYLTSGDPVNTFIKTRYTQTAVYSKLISKVELSGVFENPREVYEYEDKILPMDLEFPIEENLVPQLLELVVKELTGAAYKPKDEANDAKDSLSDIASFVRQNMKERYNKATE